jgi:metallo-beta-lactamase family protein
MQLQVCGAAREVTGSCYLVEAARCRFLVDCGLHQGSARVEAENRAPFPFDPEDLDFLLLTHAHIDHSGLIPRLVKEGFRGRVYATPATVDLADIMLLDPRCSRALQGRRSHLGFGDAGGVARRHADVQAGLQR